VASFARVVDGIVQDVVKVDDSVTHPNGLESPEDPQPGIDMLNQNPNMTGTWVQSSFNTAGGVHHGSDGKPDGRPALRGNAANHGDHYDAEEDVFYPPSPYPSWTLNRTSWLWEAPVSYPGGLADGIPQAPFYRWDEDTTSWIEVE